MTSINIVIQFSRKRDVITHGIPASGLRWFDNDNLMNTLQPNATSNEPLLNKIHYMFLFQMVAKCIQIYGLNMRDAIRYDENILIP